MLRVRRFIVPSRFGILNHHVRIVCARTTCRSLLVLFSCLCNRYRNRACVDRFHFWWPIVRRNWANEIVAPKIVWQCEILIPMISVFSKHPFHSSYIGPGSCGVVTGHIDICLLVATYVLSSATSEIFRAYGSVVPRDNSSFCALWICSSLCTLRSIVRRTLQLSGVRHLHAKLQHSSFSNQLKWVCTNSVVGCSSSGATGVVEEVLSRFLVKQNDGLFLLIVVLAVVGWLI